jgi:hypothetical protein
MKINRNSVSTASLIVIAFLVFYIFESKSPNQLSSTQRSQKVKGVNEKGIVKRLKVPKKKPSRTIAKEKTKKMEQGSLGTMAHVLAMSIEENSLEDLLKNLKTKNQKPIVSRQANPDTGEMLMIRTRAPMDGTRYFHAQYFSSQTPNEYFVQHISFDFKPGENSMEQAIAAVSSSFGDLGKPHRRTSQFISWHLDNNYVLWIKKMGPEDLQGHPFNAYGSRDVGTIKVAVEKKIHEG